MRWVHRIKRGDELRLGLNLREAYNPGRPGSWILHWRLGASFYGLRFRPVWRPGSFLGFEWKRWEVVPSTFTFTPWDTTDLNEQVRCTNHFGSVASPADWGVRRLVDGPGVEALQPEPVWVKCTVRLADGIRSAGQTRFDTRFVRVKGLSAEFRVPADTVRTATPVRRSWGAVRGAVSGVIVADGPQVTEKPRVLVQLSGCARGERGPRAWVPTLQVCSAEDGGRYGPVIWTGPVSPRKEGVLHGLKAEE